MSNNSLSFISSYFIIIPGIAALPPPYRPNALMLPINPLELLSDYIEALIKDTRAQAKTLRENDEREARVTAVMSVKPF